jgi:hypothetical protein
MENNNGRLNKNKTTSVALTTTPTDVYVSPTSFKAEVKSIFITNTSSGDVLTTVDRYDDIDATSYDFISVDIPARSFLQITDAMFLNKNDKLTAYAASNGAVTIHISVIEYFTTNIS